MKDRKVPIMKTSAKSNLAHGEANAGMAGLVKCVLMLNHHSVSPNVHFYCLNPHVDMNGYPCQISGELLDLGSNTGYAGVSSFGFGGTNARADIWAKANTGFRKVRPVDLNMLENVTVRCPKCLGSMEWKSSDAVPSRLPKPTGQGRRRAHCVRESDNYEFCSTLACHTHFRRDCSHHLGMMSVITGMIIGIVLRVIPTSKFWYAVRVYNAVQHDPATTTHKENLKGPSMPRGQAEMCTLPETLVPVLPSHHLPTG
ncbi:ppsA [Symbiodinium sp. CCMP2456]|nr:ppsA [Symbiodinium sp. CCMP2456]